MVVLGHVDAGKSTLVGHLLALTQAVSARDVDKLRHEAEKAGQGASALAWLLDATAGERGRGVTADVALTHFTPADGVRCALLDAPGHRDFVPNMIAGAAQADVCVLVVDGAPTAFERGFERGGQTREHAQLARALGVQRCVVAVNKMDRAGWDRERFDAIRAQLEPFLASVGFKAAETSFVPLSGLAGANLVEGTPELSAAWGGQPPPTLCLALADAARAASERRVAAGDGALPLRLPVAAAVDKHESRELGAGAAGKLAAGVAYAGQSVVVLPAGVPATVRVVRRCGAAAAAAAAGQAAEGGLSAPDAVALAAALRRGAVVAAASAPAPCARRLECRVQTLELSIPLLRGAAVTLHAGAGAAPARVARLVALHDPKTNAVTKAKPRAVAGRCAATIEVELSGAGETVVVEEYARCRPLGRVALRDGGATLAVGVVTKVLE